MAGVDHHVTLTFERRHGALHLNQVFWSAGDNGQLVNENCNALARLFSIAVQLGISPTRLGRRYIGSRESGGGATTHNLIPFCASALDFLWKLILLEVCGVHDFVHDDLYAAYMRRLDRRPFVHEELKDLAEPERLELPITAYTAQDGCTVCGADAALLARTGTCLTCTQCGNGVGGCA